ncbi:MAG: HAD family phosphatase [Eubacterium sp.]|nr:HAD family phosphatase [Eubacterium sp.]
MIKGVIFDVDGVLLNSMLIWKDLGARYLKSIGKVPETGLGDILFSMSMEQGADYLKKNYDLDKSEDEIIEGISKMLEDFYFYEVDLKPGVKAMVEYLRSKGIRMAAATSSPREHIERALGRNEIAGYIEKIYTTSEVGRSKHFPLIYNLASEYLGTKPQECLVFEDSLYALETAMKAGYKTVGVYDKEGEMNQEGLKELADIYLLSISDFGLEGKLPGLINEYRLDKLIIN